MPVGPNIVTTVAPSKFQGETAARQLSRLIKSTHSPSLPVEPSLRAKKNLDTESKVKFLVEKVQTPILGEYIICSSSNAAPLGGAREFG